MKGKKVLVIDDDVNLCQSIKIDFTLAGAEVHTAPNGYKGLQIQREWRPDLVVLDIRMPEMNGWDTCRHIRTASSVPIIMLTSIHQDQDIIRGLECGADDFVSKPFSRDVLFARVRAVLRRAEVPANEQAPTKYTDDYLEVDLETHQVLVRKEAVRLTSTEFKVLAFLLQNAGQTISYENLLTNVWGWEYQSDTDYVQVYLSRLRRKLEENPREPRYLLNEHGVGYRFCKQVA